MCVVLPAPSPPSNVTKAPRWASGARCARCVAGVLSIMVPYSIRSAEARSDEIVHIVAANVDSDEYGEVDDFDAAQRFGPQIPVRHRFR